MTSSTGILAVSYTHLDVYKRQNTDLAAGTTLTPAQSSQTVTLSPNTTYTITLGVVKGVTVTVGSQKIDLSTLTSDSAIITLTIES